MCMFVNISIGCLEIYSIPSDRKILNLTAFGQEIGWDPNSGVSAVNTVAINYYINQISLSLCTSRTPMRASRLHLTSLTTSGDPLKWIDCQ